MSAPLALRRDAPVTCAGCGRQVQRQSRQQRFCSDRCRKTARPARDTEASKQNRLKRNSRTNPPKIINEISGAMGRISGPSHIIDAEVWAGREWHPAISSGGVSIEIGRLRTRTLVSP